MPKSKMTVQEFDAYYFLWNFTHPITLNGETKMVEFRNTQVNSTSAVSAEPIVTYQVGNGTKLHSAGLRIEQATEYQLARKNQFTEKYFLIGPDGLEWIIQTSITLLNRANCLLVGWNAGRTVVTSIHNRET